MDTLASYGIQVPHNPSSQTRTTCPKCSHRRKKSNAKCLAVNVDEGIWMCHHCGWKGSLNNGIKEKWSNMNQNKTYKKPKWEKNNNRLPEKFINWFTEERDISEETLEAYDIQAKAKYIPNRNQKVKSMAFPYKNIDGKTITVKYRDIDKNYAMESDTKKIMFGEYQVNDGPLILVEGELDVLSCYEAGFSAISVPNGAPSSNTDIQNINMSYLQHSEDLIEQYDIIIIATDGDEVGQKLGKELARRIGYEKCYKIEYPENCKDLNDVLTEHGKDEIVNIVSEAQEFPVQGVYNFNDIEENIWSYWENGIEDDALSTGFKKLDEYYKVRSYEFTVITGIPQHGKSEFLDSIMVRMAKYHNWKFGIFSPENWPVWRHASKLISKTKEKPFENLSEPELSNTLQKVRDKYHFIYPEDEDKDLETVLDKARTLIFRYGINALVLDPFNEFQRDYSMNTKEYISQFLSRIRQFVRKHNIHIFLVAHPKKMDTKKNKDPKPPKAYDISGASEWNDKSDNIITVYRLYEKTRIYIRKVRFREIGKKGSIELKYEERKRGFTEKIP